MEAWHLKDELNFPILDRRWAFQVEWSAYIEAWRHKAAQPVWKIVKFFVQIFLYIFLQYIIKLVGVLKAMQINPTSLCGSSEFSHDFSNSIFPTPH